jgi:SHS2 domain-containing protein
MGSYRFVDDLVSDVMFEAEAESIGSLLEQSSAAMFSVICDIEKIEPSVLFEIEVSGGDELDLLFGFLCKLLSESEIRGLFLSSFSVRVKTGTGLTAVLTAGGEPISREKGGTVVKGITLYGFSVEKTEAGYKARVAMDI